MMSQEQNDLITLTSRKDPCGKLMRMYWQPADIVPDVSGNEEAGLRPRFFQFGRAARWTGPAACFRHRRQAPASAALRSPSPRSLALSPWPMSH